METEIIILGLGAFGVVIGMQFKMNRCVGRLEGMLTQHLKENKK